MPQSWLRMLPCWPRSDTMWGEENDCPPSEEKENIILSPPKRLVGGGAEPMKESTNRIKHVHAGHLKDSINARQEGTSAGNAFLQSSPSHQTRRNSQGGAYIPLCRSRCS